MSDSKAQKSLNDQNEQILANSVQVKHHEGHIMLPTDMKVSTAIEVLNKHEKSLQETCVIVEQFDCFPWDGALALKHVLNENFGWTPPPTATRRIEVGYQKTIDVAWGEFEIPDLKVRLRCGAEENSDGMFTFAVQSLGRRLSEPAVRKIFQQVRDYVRGNSIYQGAAFSIRFGDEPIPEIKFLDVSRVTKENLVYSKKVYDAVNTNLFTPIERLNDLKALGIPVKRGVLLGGPYGTGKTLAMAAAAAAAVKSRMTYMYLPDTRDLAKAIKFARNYQNPGTVIAAEDIDRIISGDEDDRTITMDAILNTLDGVDNKNANTIVILTSNNMDNIQPAMVRPGRLDAVIEVTPPDGEAAARLVGMYGGGMLRDDVDLKVVGGALSGMIPAMIAEVVQRAKLSELSLTPAGQEVGKISTKALLLSAETFRRQLELISRKPQEKMPVVEAMDIVFKAFARSIFRHEGPLNFEGLEDVGVKKAAG